MEELNDNVLGEVLGRSTKSVSSKLHHLGITRSEGARRRMRSDGGKNASHDRAGDRNHNWKGGISKNNYHYKKIQLRRYPERVRARDKVRYAIRTGKITRGDCLNCGEPNAHAHHGDYTKPLEVDWLCRGCHRALHGGKH